MALTQRAQPSMCLPILSGGNSGTYLLDYIILYTSPTRDGGGGSFYGRIRTFCFPNNLLVDKKIGLFKKQCLMLLVFQANEDRLQLQTSSFDFSRNTGSWVEVALEVSARKEA
jgi:hypothetical protein